VSEPEEEAPLAEEPAAGSPDRRWWAMAVAAGIALLLAIGLWLAYRPAPDQIQGMVDAHEVRIASKVTGRIAAFHVEEGQAVRAGQLLYTLDSPEVAARSQQAGGALASAEAMESKARSGTRPEDIRAAEAQWRRAQAAADLARTTYQRTQRLFDEGVLAGQKRDEARTNAIASEEAAKTARAQYDPARCRRPRPGPAGPRGPGGQAPGALSRIAAGAVGTPRSPPAPGEIGRRLAQPGELVPQGFPVFVLTDTAHPWVTLNVREDQLRGLARGSEITGRVPALGDRSIRFRVAYLSPAGDFATWRATRQSSGFDIKSFEVRVRPVAPVPGLRPGMTVLFDWPQ